MENSQNLQSFINLVVNENLAQAKEVLNNQLNQKLADALERKFEEFAPTIFEKWDAEKADKNRDGKISGWEEASTEWAEGDNDETKGEKQSKKEEKGESEEEEDEEDDQDSEEDGEDSEEKKD
jgi:hypothetical protein